MTWISYFIDNVENITRCQAVSQKPDDSGGFGAQWLRLSQHSQLSLSEKVKHCSIVSFSLMQTIFPSPHILKRQIYLGETHLLL